MEFFGVLTILAAIVVTILWLVIGWRAMIAHERIADAMSEWQRTLRAEREGKIRHQQPDPPMYQGWRPRSQRDDD